MANGISFILELIQVCLHRLVWDTYEFTVDRLRVRLGSSGITGLHFEFIVEDRSICLLQVYTPPPMLRVIDYFHSSGVKPDRGQITKYKEEVGEVIQHSTK